MNNVWTLAVICRRICVATFLQVHCCPVIDLVLMFDSYPSLGTWELTKFFAQENVWQIPRDGVLRTCLMLNDCIKPKVPLLSNAMGLGKLVQCKEVEDSFEQIPWGMVRVRAECHDLASSRSHSPRNF